ncbi:hypothetical protein [Paractinoplanes rishiriensis]|uniref:Gram-positive cocci surface proteins LPxTG domain-containing protein n=1 Tax=Paractinoplanes rishiriensis TaxID=1050105 RepID=A0A919K662_9ACTN|nr:hypothetical protein [Actinoplanes rishiriensis]GIF01657.1 hypothetical protein Ari01nite_91210 [Actinoplanes rishiriensis]
MRLLRIIAAALLVVVAALAGPAPARAGGWATTLLDPLPAKIAPGVAYTIGFWVLQHGSHPFWGENLGEVALLVTDDTGRTVTYQGSRLPEPGHFAAAVVFERAGTWEITSSQGVFGDYPLGKATVPGGFRALPVPPEYADIKIDYTHWKTIRPPGPAPLPKAVPVAAAETTPAPRGGSWGAALIGGAVLVAAAGALILTRRRPRRT